MGSKGYRWQSILLVTAQMTGIVAIMATGPWLAQQPGLLLLEACGVAIGLWALLTMRRATFSVMPDVKAGAQFVDHGPYRWIRHPMYLAVLLVTVALVSASWTWWRLAIWALLALAILVKIDYEERLLRAHYPIYATYRRQTKRLLPYVF
ncbi:MAG: isoprenylcysteine carboxylmethyltransferase family protein [Caldilineaceae bacterium]|nr:isoprenylcysteine carboxylmethyltransferase family protein [Caldilineaceae bacterium]